MRYGMVVSASADMSTYHNTLIHADTHELNSDDESGYLDQQ